MKKYKYLKGYSFRNKYASMSINSVMGTLDTTSNQCTLHRTKVKKQLKLQKNYTKRDGQEDTRETIQKKIIFVSRLRTRFRELA